MLRKYILVHCIQLLVRFEQILSKLSFSDQSRDHLGEP